MVPTVRKLHHVIGLLLALSAFFIWFDPRRAPVLVFVCLSTSALVWRDAWRGASGTALRPALLWAALALVLSASAQAIAVTEPFADGRPLTGRLTYIAVLALLAALISVLNARTPGERVWALLMALLILVFLIPWLEGSGRMRRVSGLASLYIDSPWTLFYGTLAVVGVTNYLPTKFGWAAACLGAVFILEYLGLTRVDWPPELRALLWEWVSWTVALSAWVARWIASRTPNSQGFERLWFWFRDHWGVVWALRTQERFNRSAELARWPVRLSWFGLVASGASQERSRVDDLAAAATFRGLIRRFAQAWRLDQVADLGPTKSCDGGDAGRR
jgi:hypothetical protein